VSIHILPPETAAKIAAGEVIQRPSSVVKELIENSIDANSKKIDIYIEEGGKELIRVTDDGAGIAAREVELAVRRFATSKLETANDLERITTFGFRGEALGSIAEVSEITIETQEMESTTGVMLRVKAGNILDNKEIVRSSGTTVSVARLFYNLPARRAFLKSEPAERRLVLEVVRNYALCFNKIRFEVRTGNRILAVYQPTDDWLERVREVYPLLSKAELIPFEESHSRLSVQGLIVRPDQSRELERMQRIFFNSRPVLYRTVYRAVLEAFGPQPGGQAPFFILKLVSPPEMLDANMHPAKTEVRYRDERFLFDFLTQLVRRTIHRQALETMRLPEVDVNLRERYETDEQKRQLSMDSTTTENSLSYPHISRPPFHIETSLTSSSFSPSSPSSSYQSPQAMDESYDNQPFRVHETGVRFWQLQNSYILAQIASGLVIVDQHAAHERILYEEMLERISTSSAREPLLFPYMVELSPEEFATFEEIEQALMSLGFEAKPFGPNQIIVETLPAGSRITPGDLKDLFREFNATNEVKLGNRDKMAALISCKAAVKAGRVLSQSEMESLINRLFNCKTPYFCPHGRPTVIKFTMDDLAKRFGRI
jgi:DNA mismatch repair protein MutL